MPRTKRRYTHGVTLNEGVRCRYGL